MLVAFRQWQRAHAGNEEDCINKVISMCRYPPLGGPSLQCKEVAYSQQIRENHAKAKTPCVSFDYTIKQSFTAEEADGLMSKLVWPSVLKFPHGLANGMTAPTPTSDDENDDDIDSD